jgi:hypothetical protein
MGSVEGLVELLIVDTRPLIVYRLGLSEDLTVLLTLSLRSTLRFLSPRQESFDLRLQRVVLMGQAGCLWTLMLLFI